MHLVHVIPIARGIGKELLSYFSASEIPAGSIVKVPVRNRTVPALAVGSEPVSEAKTELKNSTFAIKKIGSANAKTLFLPGFIGAAEDTAEYCAGTTGGVLSTITSTTILENADKLNVLPAREVVASTPEVHEPYALQANEEERLAYYKSFIREQFARKKSVFFCLPSIQDSKRFFLSLPKGIEQYTFILNSSLTKKDLIETWNKIIAEEHPVLIVSTGSFIGIPRHDLGAIVIEHESSSGYKTQTRPYVDVRTFAEFYAKKIGARLIFGDILLRVETLWHTRNGDFAEVGPLKFRSISTAEVSLIDMKKYKNLETPEFRILSEELENLAKACKENHESLFVYASRRGLSPLTVCGDCGTAVLCNRCSAPVVLHTSTAGNFFMCHRCGERRSAEERCRNCDSWRLTTLGIGIELIENALKGMFPDVKIFRMDKDTVTTHKQALSIASQFYNSPGSILIGTEMALSYLEKPVENSAVASIDSLFSIPDFRINEKIMNILLKIRAITHKNFIVQTRSSDQHVFDYAIKGNLMDFYREEIDERKKLDYPPFSTLIKISTKGTRERVVADMKFVQELLADYTPIIFPAFIETVNKKTIMHALLKIKDAQWIQKPLLEKLRALPPHVAVNVDPESLL
jgi:primosomal protein N' (replication factor Y)